MRIKVCFCWDGFPQYAARCIGAFVKATGIETVVLATRPGVPVGGMESYCGCKVIWIGREDDVRARTELRDITHVFMTGWFVPAFMRLGRVVRTQGGKVICLVDNGKSDLDVRAFRRLGVWKDALKSVRFRLKLRGRFDGFMVPGKCGRRLLEGYGVAPELITEGMYAADATLFRAGPPLKERPKTIIYVGQFIERKNVKRMLEAFHRSLDVQAFRRLDVDGWTLELYGSGPLKGELEQLIQQSPNLKSNNLKSNNQTIHIHDFVQPEQLAALYRSARIFCLPSLDEHWGLVVHEAALSGCALALSGAVCAAEDLLGKANGVMFDPRDVEDMSAKLSELMAMDDAALAAAREESLALASGISPELFVKGVATWLK